MTTKMEFTPTGKNKKSEKFVFIACQLSYGQVKETTKADLRLVKKSCLRQAIEKSVPEASGLSF